MSSFHELQDLSHLSYKNGTIDDFSVLYEELMPKNTDFSYEQQLFSPEEMNDDEFSAGYNLQRPSRCKIMND